MIRNRFNGICLSLILLLLLTQIVVFQLWIYLGINDIFLSLNPNSSPQVYLIGIFVALLLGSRHLYSYQSRILHLGFYESGLVVLHITVIFATCSAFIYFTLKDAPTSRWFLLTHLVAFTWINLCGLKFLPKQIARHLYPTEQNDQAVILLFDTLSKPFASHLEESSPSYGCTLTGYYAEQLDAPLSLPRQGPLDTFEAKLNAGEISPDSVLVFSNHFQAPNFAQIIEACQRQGIRVQVYSDFFDLFDNHIQLSEDGRRQYFSPMNEPLENPVHRALKRFLDLTISIPAVLFVYLPMIPVVWLMQQKDAPGPLLFKQQRYGMNRQPFTIYKFRTMYVEPSSVEEETQTSEQDQRVSRFGSFLRKTSLDEIPQFLNVLRGEMSIVGPRPHFVKHDETFEQALRQYRFRHFVKPGITGHAQACGFRGEISSEELLAKRIEHDLYYINHWTFWFDIRIILKTAFQVIFPPKSAY